MRAVFFDVSWAAFYDNLRFYYTVMYSVKLRMFAFAFAATPMRLFKVTGCNCDGGILRPQLHARVLLTGSFV